MAEYKITKIAITSHEAWTVGTNGEDEWIKNSEGEEIYRGVVGQSLIHLAMALAENAKLRGAVHK